MLIYYFCRSLLLAASLLASSAQRPSVCLYLTSSLLLANSHQPHFASAADLDKENEVKSILQRMESDVLAYRDEIERVYSSRCETKTLTECYESNFNGCSSAFPNQQCMKSDELVISACGDGDSCNALWDKTISTISLPASLTNAPLGNPSNPEIIESACYSRLAEPYMVNKYRADEAFWSKYNVQPSWTYFGAHNGLFRKIPATHEEECGMYDPRRRPWFVAASSGPKDVVLVIDTSGSMNDYNRMNIAKEAAITIIDTLTVADRVAAVSFSSIAYQIGGQDAMIRATSENKKMLIRAIRDLEAKGATNFYDAFNVAFSALYKTIRTEATSGCNVAMLFMTDGDISEGPGEDNVISLVNERVEQFTTSYNRKTTIFTFSLGQGADHKVTKRIACSTNGIWTPVDDTGDLVSAMSSYYKLYAIGLGEGGNDNFMAWVEPYDFNNPAGKRGTTVSAPVYDRSVSPPLFLGVVAIDMYMDAFEAVLGENATSSDMLDRFVLLSTAQCPTIELTECELDALRLLGGEEATCDVCNSSDVGNSSETTSYSGIVPEKCPFQSDLPNNLWHNTELEGYGYRDRTCCENGGTIPSESCPVSDEEVDTGPDGSSEEAGAVVGIIILIAMVLGCAGCICGCCYLIRGGNRPQVAVNYSIPSAAAQPPPPPTQTNTGARPSIPTAAPQPMSYIQPNGVNVAGGYPVPVSTMQYGNQPVQFVQPQPNVGAAYNPSHPPVNPMYGRRYS